MRRVLAALRRITTILDAVNERGPRLRHVSPSDVVIDPDSGDVRLVGLEWTTFDPSRTVLPRFHDLVLRSPWLAPELRADPAASSRTADRYGAAALAVFMLTGHAPPLRPELVGRLPLPEAARALFAHELGAGRPLRRAGTLVDELGEALTAGVG